MDLAHKLRAQLPITNSNVLGKLPIRVTRTIGKLEIAIGGFGKIQYTCDGEGPVLLINVD
jgi:hypothetical protein